MALHDEYDIQVSAGTVSRRHVLNLVPGTGISLSLTDNSASDRSDVTVSATGASVNAPMAYNIIGGWVGSTVDPASTQGGAPSALSTGVIYAAAFVADTATAFSNLGFISTSAMTGSGAVFTVTDSSGNNLASATNSDTQLALSGGFHEMALSAPVTPTAGSIYYVVFLFPTTVTGVPPLRSVAANVSAVNAGNGNHRFGSSGSGQTTIPNPFSISGAVATGNLPFFSLR